MKRRNFLGLATGGVAAAVVGREAVQELTRIEPAADAPFPKLAQKKNETNTYEYFHGYQNPYQEQVLYEVIKSRHAMETRKLLDNLYLQTNWWKAS